MDFKALFRELGLDEKESIVYLALLRIGMSTVNKLAEVTDLVRTTTYDVLKKLREKGLVSSISRNNILHFEAADPERLIDDFEIKKRLISEALPELRKFKVPSFQGPTIELYEGVEGIRTIWQDILKEKQPLFAISNYHSLFNTLNYLSPRFILQRVQMKIPAKLITERTSGAIETWKNNDKRELRETRFMPFLEKTKVTEYIYGSKVAVLSTEAHNPLGMLIRHQDFAKQQLTIFERLWKQAKS